MKKVALVLIPMFLAVVLLQSSSIFGYEKMLRKPKEKICSLCHADKDKNFTTSGHGKFQVTCQMCHNPHGQGVSAMLRWNEEDFCIQCHSQMKEHYTKSGHGKLGVACQQCHDPHGTEGAAPAKAPEKAPEKK